MLTVTIIETEGAVSLGVTGSIDALSAAQLETAMNEQLAKGHRRVVLDLGGVEFTSSTGLRLILSGAKEARRRGGDLRLAAVRPPVLRVLELSGFLGILKTYADCDAAVASFRA
jgi:anti-sigma B factor antagonist